MPNAIKIDGLKELQRDLRTLTDKDTPKAIRLSNKEAADMVAAEGARRAPKDSGRLARSVKAQATQTSASVKAGSAARVPYAGPIHFGWHRRKIRPNPFLYKALDARLGEVHRTYARKMEEVLRRYAD